MCGWPDLSLLLHAADNTGGRRRSRSWFMGVLTGYLSVGRGTVYGKRLLGQRFVMVLRSERLFVHS